MAKRQSSLAEQLEELESAANQLNDYQKLFDKACQINFGMTAKSIQKLTENNTENISDFERKISNFFGLKTAADKADFISVMCSESSRKFFRTKREADEVAATEQG